MLEDIESLGGRSIDVERLARSRVCDQHAERVRSRSPEKLDPNAVALAERELSDRSLEFGADGRTLGKGRAPDDVREPQRHARPTAFVLESLGIAPARPPKLEVGT
jgi:hypothetical protein